MTSVRKNQDYTPLRDFGKMTQTGVRTATMQAVALCTRARRDRNPTAGTLLVDGAMVDITNVNTPLVFISGSLKIVTCNITRPLGRTSEPILFKGMPLREPAPTSKNGVFRKISSWMRRSSFAHSPLLSRKLRVSYHRFRIRPREVVLSRYSCLCYLACYTTAVFLRTTVE